MFEKYRFKHTCNDDIGIRRRKQQKLANRILHVNFLSRHYLPSLSLPLPSLPFPSSLSSLLLSFSFPPFIFIYMT